MIYLPIFILQGFKIEATCDNPLALPNGFSVEVGAWFDIYNFKVTPAFAKIKKASGVYSINIGDSSMVSKIEPINDCSFLCFAKFDCVFGGLCHPKFCIGMLILPSQESYCYYIRKY